MALHTYDFYRRRKYDPKWREAYISARNARIITFFIELIIVALGVQVYFYVISHNVTLKDINLVTAKDFGLYVMKNIKTALFFSLDYIKQFVKE
ncbi:hypothetical protein [Lactococcus taiwanensis]|uniref:hypothetical protein n=1 Tax=Lactococcus taiwanensis TaxID=1151742 RepID=UPI003513DC73